MFQSSLVMQQVKHLALQQLELLLWRGLNTWPTNFRMPRAWPKEAKTNQTKPSKWYIPYVFLGKALLTY